ncbi:MAG TPA: NAD(P)H-hydrate dehydratase [Gammaproteobacteria bacterium]|nr:NAD(P)H-hydrate dehydratase [Gammaproteobacteria bacterium]
MVNLGLPIRLYDAAAVRALDEAAIEHAGVPGLTLMTRAGVAAFRVLCRRWPGIECIAVVCGQGNNAGDGYVVARLARAAGYRVRVVQTGDPDSLGADARECFDAMRAAGVEPLPELAPIDTADVVVDALLGTGLTRAVEGPFAVAVERINEGAAPVLSIDIPSGINATTGQRMGTSVRAATTITFIGLKQGLFTADAPQYTGEVAFDDIGVPQVAYERVRPTASLLELRQVRNSLRPRSRTAHKGDHGHLLVIGGAPGFSGAIRLAGEAAARAGVGLVSVAAHPDVAAVVNTMRPELMAHAVAGRGDLEPLLARADVVAIGPGLGQSDWAVALFADVLNRGLPLVVDADALNLLAADPMYRDDWVLTPHPGEAARLLGVSSADILADRFAAAAELRARYGGAVVLKGAGSIIAGADVPAVLAHGNPGMGSGGMGDVLTGIIGAFIGQGLTAEWAARAGACVHAAAGDRAAARGERGLLALDLMPHIRALVN